MLDMKALIIAAHPDDEVLGCGGTIARLSPEGSEESIAIFGEGITSRENVQDDRVLVEELHCQSQEVGSFLGAIDVRFFKLPDNKFDTVPLLEIAKLLEGLIREIKPDTIFTQHGGDLNIDHVTLFRAVLTATRPIEGAFVRRVYAFEVGSSTEWSFGKFSPVFRPNTFINIGATLEKKVEAMQMYSGEVRSFPHPRSPEAIRATAQRWGSCVGVKAAEAFELIRDIR